MAIVLSDVNAVRLAGGIQDYSQGERDYWIVDMYRPLAELKQLLSRWRPVGVITQWDAKIVPEILKFGYPTVFSTADRYVPNVGRVDVDDEAVGRQAADHLLETGLRNFAYLGNLTHYSGQRLKGFRQRLREEKLGCATLMRELYARRHSIEHWQESDTELHNWVKRLPKPVGIFAAHDPLGRYLAEACRDAGLRIPEDVAIVGADNDTLICSLTYPPLSSVRIPWAKIGFETARMMEEILETGVAPRQPILVAPESVEPRLSSDLLAIAHPRVQAALRVIRDRACEGLSVKQLLSYLHTSRRSLEQEFKKHLGRTPREEIVRVRLATAKSLLSQSDLSMPMIAERCGFGGAERFSVVFRQVEGMPPTRYREQYRLAP